MFLAEPQPTSADLHFTVRGIPVRVSAWFWVAAALLGWSVCQSMAQGDQRELLRYLLVRELLLRKLLQLSQSKLWHPSMSCTTTTRHTSSPTNKQPNLSMHRNDHDQNVNPSLL